EKIIGTKPALNPLLVRLAEWISNYYCCPIEAVMRSVLPQVIRKAKVEHKTHLVARLDRLIEEKELAEIERKAPKQADVIAFLQKESRPVAVAGLIKECGANHQTIQSLAKKGFIAI